MKYLTKTLFLLFALIIAVSCTQPEESPESVADEQSDRLFSFSITLSDADENPITPSGAYLYDAEEGITRTPLQTFPSDGFGLIEGVAEPGRPYILRIHSAAHLPLYLFIPGTAGDRLSVHIQPEPAHFSEAISPKLIGSFNNYDRFRAVEMTLQPNGSWQAEVDTPSDTLRYLITDTNRHLALHGTDGDLVASDHHTPTEQGIESILTRNNNEPFTVRFDPAAFEEKSSGYSIQFDSSTPARTAAVAKAYAAMMSQDQKLKQLYASQSEITPEHFEAFLASLHSVTEQFEHEDAKLAAQVAKSRFIKYLNPDDEWADHLLGSLPPGSDLWLMHQTAVGDLFSVSTRMERVSQNLWDIYRQNRSDLIRGEALYSLLEFHYERGEDEEWYQAHFDLVREYPGHPRINYSYNRGYAPESVVFVGRYFPDLTFRSADRNTEFTPSEIDARLSVLFFWKPDDEQSLKQIQRLSRLYDRFKDDGLSVTAVALYPDAERIMRFHDHHNLTWNTAAETLQSATVQVIGITSVPHTIVLDAGNRVLVHNDAFLNDERIEEMIEEYFRNQ